MTKLGLMTCLKLVSCGVETLPLASQLETVQPTVCRIQANTDHGREYYQPQILQASGFGIK